MTDQETGETRISPLDLRLLRSARTALTTESRTIAAIQGPGTIDGITNGDEVVRDLPPSHTCCIDTLVYIQVPLGVTRIPIESGPTLIQTVVMN